MNQLILPRLILAASALLAGTLYAEVARGNEPAIVPETATDETLTPPGTVTSEAVEATRVATDDLNALPPVPRASRVHGEGFKQIGNGAAEHVSAPVRPGDSVATEMGIDWTSKSMVRSRRKQSQAPNKTVSKAITFMDLGAINAPAEVEAEPVVAPADSVPLNEGEMAKTILDLMERIPSVLEGTEMQHSDQFETVFEVLPQPPAVPARITTRDEMALSIRRLEAERAERAQQNSELSAVDDPYSPDSNFPSLAIDVIDSPSPGDRECTAQCPPVDSHTSQRISENMLVNPTGAAEALQLMANEIELIAQKLESQTMFAQADDLREQARRLRLDARECLARTKTSEDAEAQSARRHSQEQQW